MALWPTQFCIQWAPRAVSLKVKRPVCEADHSPPCATEVKNAWGYTFTPQYVLTAWCLVKNRDTFTFTFTFIDAYTNIVYTHTQIRIIWELCIFNVKCEALSRANCPYVSPNFFLNRQQTYRCLISDIRDDSQHIWRTNLTQYATFLLGVIPVTSLNGRHQLISA